jgi:hypothetical protein
MLNLITPKTMKRYLYYSLIAMITASSVSLSSCDDEEDPVVIDNNSGTNTTPEVNKFTVTITLNGTKVFSQEAEEGKSITLNLDKLAENPLVQDALKGYEILSITQDGKEVNGEITVNTTANYEINAIKYAVLEYALPANGKILHSSFYNEKSTSKRGGDPEHTDIWAYATKDNKLKCLFRYEYAEKQYQISQKIRQYDATTGIIYDESYFNKTYYAENKTYYNYGFMVGDKYYITEYERFEKTNASAKGYQTEWNQKIINPDYSKDAIEENNSEENAETVEINSITIAADKVADDASEETSYEYKDGFITLENGKKYIYDGTYLYEVTSEFDIEDYTPFPTIELADVSNEKFADGYSKKDNTNVFIDEDDFFAGQYYGAFDWDNDQIDQSDWFNTAIGEYDTYPLGEIDTKWGTFSVFPDNKVYVYSLTYDLGTDKIFTYGNYIVFNTLDMELGY